MNVLRKYTWLLSVLRQTGGLTLKQISDKWRESRLNDGGIKLNRRTFQRWKNETEDLFNVTIECNCRRGYKYYIDIDRSKSDQVTSWLIHSLTISNLIDEYKSQSDYIILEDVPSGEEHLETILQSISYGKQLIVTYQKFNSIEPNKPALVNPLCVRIFNRRWYVVVEYAEKINYRRVMALDRIKEAVLQETDYTIPDDFSPKQYFADSYGITVKEELPTRKVVLKFPLEEAIYIKTLPIHHSQKEVKIENGYCYLQYNLKITLDFAFALLPHCVHCDIIEPAELRTKVNELAQRIINNTKTL